MTFKFTFRVDPVGMTVPYAAIADDIRNNSGFEDLRGRPDKASAIAEGNASPALRRLLVRIANVGSTIFTLGCELGSHQEPTHVPMRRREVAGGYVQFAMSVALFLILLIGMSRIYLGVHYPTDVLGGWCIGAAWAMGCWVLTAWLQNRGQVEPPEPS